MKKQIQKLFSLHMLRPVLYRTLTFVAASACLAAIWNRCVNARGLYPVHSYVFPVLGVLWLILCWFCFFANGSGLAIFSAQAGKGTLKIL